jgi:hypothetical protein
MKKITTCIIAAAFIICFHADRAYAWILFDTNIPGGNQFLNNVFLKYQDQSKLVRGFANASAFSSQVATQRGYQGYDKFIITLGSMGAAQVPYSATNLSYYKHLAKKLDDQGDVYAGVAWNAWALNVGVRLPADVYVSVKFGKLRYSFQDYDFDGMTAGGMINFPIFKPMSPPVKIILWRGLTIGAGFLWQYNKTAFHYKAGTVSSGGFIVKPNIKIFAKTESYVIPLELSTAVRLFWFLNIHAGGGIDFAMGSSRLNYSGIGYVIDSGTSTVGLYSLYGRQGGTGPRTYMPKIFCGPGLSLGPVIIDVPFTYYFMNGFNVGLTVGVVW